MSLTGDKRKKLADPVPPSQDISPNPRLRSVDPQWVTHQGQPFIHLRDPLGLTDQVILVPQAMAPLLALCDGSRDVPALRAALALRTGLQLTNTQIEEFVQRLDTGCLLENDTYLRAAADALKAYQEAEHRTPSHADLVYPSDPEGLSRALDEYGAKVPASDDSLIPSTAGLAGVVSPHIDYERGGDTYAQLWRRCAPAIQDIELAIIFGTDHAGSPGALTLTRQNYATPLGVLPTDLETVEGLAEAVGPEKAFSEEAHHIGEHSIELAAVWFHHSLGGRACGMVPILCGSFDQFIRKEKDPEDDEAIKRALDFLRKATADRRTLIIAAGDLAHVGPAFGDSAPIDPRGRAKLAAEDAQTVKAICKGDAAGFYRLSQAESDTRRLCGLPPIYMALRLLDGAWGESMGYAQCHADVNGGSLVSIVGALLYQGA